MRLHTAYLHARAQALIVNDHYDCPRRNDYGQNCHQSTSMYSLDEDETIASRDD